MKVILLIFLAIASIFVGCSNTKDEYEVNIPSGATKTVANGRASIWYGMPLPGCSTGDGGTQTCALIEIQCGGKAFERRACPDDFSESACGVIVKLLQFGPDGYDDLAARFLVKVLK